MAPEIALHVQAVSRRADALAGGGTGTGAAVTSPTASHIGSTPQILPDADVLLGRSARRMCIAGQTGGQSELAARTVGVFS